MGANAAGSIGLILLILIDLHPGTLLNLCLEPWSLLEPDLDLTSAPSRTTSSLPPAATTATATATAMGETETETYDDAL